MEAVDLLTTYLALWESQEFLTDAVVALCRGRYLDACELAGLS